MSSSLPDPPAPARPARAFFMRFLRLAVGLGLMAVLLWYADPVAVWRSLAGSSPTWLGGAVLLVVVDRIANAYRWLLLLRAVEPTAHLAFATIVRVFLVSGFLGSFLPGSVGGDAVRTYALMRLDVHSIDALASVLVDRLLGIVSVFLMAGLGLVAARQLFTIETFLALATLAALGAVGSSVFLFDSRVAGRLVSAIGATPLRPLARHADRAFQALRQYGHQRRTLMNVLLLSIGVQVLRTLQAWAIGRALGVDVSIIWYFAFLPVAILVMLLPTSVAGLGTGALAFQLLFGTVGVSAADAWVMALLFSALSVVGNLPGGVLFATERLPRRAPGK